MKQITLSEGEKTQISHQLDKWFAAENKDNEEVEQAIQRLGKLDRKEKMLQELVLEGEISKEDFKEHRMRIEAERAELEDLVDVTTTRRGLIRADFDTALEIAGKLDLLYENGDNNNRRLLCEALFRQVWVRNGTIVKIEANSPFRLILSEAKGSEPLLSGQPSSSGAFV